MAIPGYQEFMLPLLRLAQDKLEHTMSDATEVLAKVMGISEADQELRIASGTQTRFYNRVAWAVTYLTKSGLLEKPARGRFRIAPRGVEVLKENPTRIDNAFLARFPEYNAFKAKKVDPEPAKQVDGGEVIELAEDTPDEQMDRAFEELREALADEILTRVRSVSPKAFEHLVVDLLRAMGYGLPEADAAKVVGRSGDGGVDGVILEDRLGLDMVYVQAKRYTSDVGPAPIREFVGSL